MVGWVSLAAATVIQFFFAILVRQYANSLFLKHDDPERGTVCFGGPVREMDGFLVNQNGSPHRTRRASASSCTASRELEKVC